MAYEIIRTKEFNNIENNEPIKLLKYAILKKDDKYYAQLKLKNDSNFAISRFEFEYKTEEGKQIYTSEKISALPGDIFFSSNIIEIPSERFAFLGFKNVYAKKQRKEEVKEQVNERTLSDSFFSRNKDILITILFIVLATFNFVSAWLMACPPLLITLDIYPIFGMAPSFFINLALFILWMVLLGRHISKLNLKGIDPADVKKKDLSLFVLWGVSLMIFSMVPIIMSIESEEISILIFSLMVLIVGVILLVIYFSKNKKYKNENLLIQRKYIWLNSIFLAIFVAIYSFYAVNKFFN